MKVTSAFTFLFWIGQNDGFAAAFNCQVCGEFKKVTNNEAVVAVDSLDGGSVGNYTCEQLEYQSVLGAITEEQCESLQPVVQEPCGCVGEPTLPPFPDCFDDIDLMMQFEDFVEDVTVPREYVLCPNTEFYFGFGTQNGYEGGMVPIEPRANSHYKCGQDGSSENNCLLIDGEFPFIAFFSEPEYPTNITVTGMTFKANTGGAALFAEAGDITFVDCKFIEQNAQATIISFYDLGARRHLRQNVLTGETHKDVAALMKWYADRDFEEELGEVETKGDQGRGAQEALGQLDLVFKNCVFENIVGQDPGGYYVKPGIVTALSAETSLFFDGCDFKNNDFGASNLPASYAISTPGALTMTNSCFEMNKFNRLAPIVSTGDPFPFIEVSNNFVDDSDADLACPFLAQFPDEDDKVALEAFACVDFDAATCRNQPATVEESEDESKSPGTTTSLPLGWLLPVTLPLLFFGL